MKNLYAKLAKVMEEVAYIQKDKTNTHQGYKYASEAAIKEKFHESFVKNGLLFFLTITDSYMHRDINNTTQKGEQKSNLLIVDFAYTFADVESGETFVGHFQGSGADTGDKALYKAITGALKYILTSTFLVATGDDPEEDIATQVQKDFAKPKMPIAAAAERNPLMDDAPFPDTPPPIEYVPGVTDADPPKEEKTCSVCSNKYIAKFKWSSMCVPCYIKSKEQKAP